MNPKAIAVLTLVLESLSDPSRFSYGADGLTKAGSMVAPESNEAHYRSFSGAFRMARIRTGAAWPELAELWVHIHRTRNTMFPNLPGALLWADHEKSIALLTAVLKSPATAEGETP